jgi:chemotaxis regulatin CheY-phosphate phosphatase CheZ
MEAGKHIELSLGQEPGEFRLNLDGIAITIHMKTPQPGQAAGGGTGISVSLPAAPALQAAATLPGKDSQDTGQVSPELDYYRQVSREIYDGLGKLAKDINLSIQDLSLAEIIQTAMGSPGEGLDQARNQVTDVLLMTEQATLNIMDLVEQIRGDCQDVQTKLQNLTAPPPPGESGELSLEAAPDHSADQGLWDEVLSQAEEMGDLLRSPEPQGISPAAGVPIFSLADILQILLEFCTNEKVKQHLKAVQAKQDAIFRTTEAEQALSLLAAGALQEDGFYQLPVEPLLNLLKSHCEDERVQELFTKMASSGAKLFPVAALPLEAQEMEEEFADELAEPPGYPEVTARWEKLQHAIKLLAEQRQTCLAGGPARMSHPGSAAEVQQVLGTVDRITDSLSRIVEALAFQDLSGQRLLKILKIIRQLQVQVLTLLVASGQKLLVNLDDQPLPTQGSDLARKELDRLLHSFSPPADQEFVAPSHEQPLDQDAVNDLLTSMGF